MKRRRRTTDRDGVGSPLMFQILLVLCTEDSHGYGMLQEIERRTGGAYEIGAATLYRTIQRLLEAQMIEETKGDGSPHQQRRVYRITEAGRQRARAEAARLERVVQWAKTTTAMAEKV